MKSQVKVLLVEDELALARIVQDNLEQNGYAVHHASNGEEALRKFHDHKPDLVLLDVMIPKVNGFNVSKTIRNQDRQTPILFLTAKVHVKDVVRGFESGGSDYIRKPFSIEELLIRMKVLLNGNRVLDHSDENDQEVFDLGELRFDSRKFELRSGEERKKLTAKEAELLRVLCQNQNKLITKKSLLFAVWEDDSFFNSRSLDVFISRLRKHFKEEPKVAIINVRGVGYKLLVD